ncbi:TetR family transcriptional regulator [Nocardioides oleivorans]|uniref:TetR family transcriptional regulator n=1 Tax=Nocardioides oleivorans TaxID=273676 RepID=A0A4Q2RRN5_9ACTN|nr:TetR/AcrR family transcriptional regulator [Nocardioides oleivorans]RYB91661.1 TetR family transcriptional regulator [Nocardioides oleivorans]
MNVPPPPSSLPDRDAAILAAAGRALARDPRASMATIAAEAGVGMSAFYRRWASKDALVLALNLQFLAAYEAAINAANEMLDSGAPAVDVLGDHLHSLLGDEETYHADPTVGLPARGTPEHERWLAVSRRNQALFERFSAEGALREGVTFVDLGLVFTAATSAHGETPDRTVELRHRLLDMLIDGLRPGAPPLTGRGPTTVDYYGENGRRPASSPASNPDCGA